MGNIKLFALKSFIFVFCLRICNSSLIRHKRQDICRAQSKFSCKNKECIKNEFLCNSKADCKDGSDESLDVCNNLDTECLVPKDINGTTYEAVDCRKQSKECLSKQGLTVKIKCSPGFVIPYSVNGSVLLKCPSKNWDRRLTHCTKCSHIQFKDSQTLKEGIRKTDIKKYPWHVSIHRIASEIPHCGGSIIAPHVVLSAATCFFNLNSVAIGDPSLFKVVAGKNSYHFTKNDIYTQEIHVEQIILSQEYSAESTSEVSNLAILKLKREFEFNLQVQPVCLRAIVLGPDNLVSVPGWGLSYQEEYKNGLREGHFSFINVKACRKKSPSLTFLTYFNFDKFCVLSKSGEEVGFANHDTGNGLVSTIGGTVYLVGLVNFKPLEFPPFAVVTNLTKHYKWIRATLSSLVPLSDTLRCLKEENFVCPDGTCVKKEFICDGTDDCDDGSDELDCDELPNLSPNNGCLLPVLKGVIYKNNSCMSGSCIIKPGRTIPSNTFIKVDCKNGYDVTEYDYNVTSCLKSEFFPALPSCLKLCNAIKSDSLNVECTFKGNRVSCNKPLPPTTRVQHECKYHYKPQDLRTFRTTNVCLKTGQWLEDFPTCQPECGKSSPLGDIATLISFGKQSKLGTHPWHVGIYKLNVEKNEFEHICGGSIISEKVVISAAHCLYNETTNSLFRQDHLKLIAGKFYRDFYVKEANLQVYNVKEIVINNYYGYAVSFYQDIALMVLDQKIEFNSYISPVCLDEGHLQIPPNGKGIIAGWGLTEQKEFSSELLEVTMEYLPLETCHTSINSDFKQFLSADKLCALYNKGAGVQPGDSGGGLTVVHNNIVYLYGIFSLKDTSTNKFAAFTKIAKHINWIRSVMNRKF